MWHHIAHKTIPHDGATIITKRISNGDRTGAKGEEVILIEIDFAKKEKDRKNLLLGYSTAFYSHKSRKNLEYLLDFIISEKKDDEIKKLNSYPISSAYLTGLVICKQQGVYRIDERKEIYG